MGQANGYLLVSSNYKGSLNQTGAVGKSFQPFSDEKNEVYKAPALGLDLDIVNLQDYYKNNQWQIKVCETSMHKKECLKRRSEVLSDIKQHFQKSIPLKFTVAFYFTGHGYPNGDLCIETQQNPSGEHLQIEQILDIIIECAKNSDIKLFYIYIDSCYSGRNVERSKQYLMKKKPKLVVVLYCSSGPQYQSITTSVGSLLIAAHCQKVNPMIKQKQSELADKFEIRKPLSLEYWPSEKMNEPEIQIRDIKFSDFCK